MPKALKTNPPPGYGYSSICIAVNEAEPLEGGKIRICGKRYFFRELSPEEADNEEVYREYHMICDDNEIVAGEVIAVLYLDSRTHIGDNGVWNLGEVLGTTVIRTVIRHDNITHEGCS